MIKLICTECGSDDIYDISEECETAMFRCDNCSYEFSARLSDDMWEFDTR